MKWRLAKSLEMLRAQVNDKWPKRSKESDGSIGDANHASRSSDHNPHISDPGGPNVVSAIDITHDPKNGLNSYVLAEALRASRDKRIKYIISNRKICSSQTAPWQWRSYTGSNPHDHHVHISVLPDKKLYDDLTPWNFDPKVMEDTRAYLETVAQPTLVVRPTLRRGATGSAVKDLQLMLGIAADGVYGMGTFAAVKKLQAEKGLVADGVVGPQTWRIISSKKGATNA